MTVEQTLQRLKTGLSGLSDVDAMQWRGDDLVDELGEDFMTAAVSEMDTPLTGPLAAGAGGGGVSAASGSLLDAALVGAVMVGNAILGAGQRVAASQAVRQLASAGALKTRLRRQRGEVMTNATDLVPGDIIALQAGDAVPADCRVVQDSQLEVDESSLTGESLPVGKTASPSSAAAVADRSSMVYQGTTVVAGTALAVVVAVGRSTEAGRSGATAQTGEAPGGVEGRPADALHAAPNAAVPHSSHSIAAGAGRRTFVVPREIMMASRAEFRRVSTNGVR